MNFSVLLSVVNVIAFVVVGVAMLLAQFKYKRRPDWELVWLLYILGAFELIGYLYERWIF